MDMMGRNWAPSLLLEALDPENRTRQNWENATGPQFGRPRGCHYRTVFKVGHRWKVGGCWGYDTVDGRSPAPPWMVEPPQKIM